VALHLIRQPTALTLVDGYNVAKLGWPGLALADQRECCLDGVEDLVRRYGIRAHVVFDGASIVGLGSGRRLVRVTFTPAGVSADDEIRGQVRELPVDQALVVVTNDREIIRAVRSSGANVISSDQLLAVIRR
jgi:predicted RNA-binding protein with PIN domain